MALRLSLAAARRPVVAAPRVAAASTGAVRGHAVAVDPTPASSSSSSLASDAQSGVRHNWKRAEVQAIYDGPLMETIFRAASVHRLHHDASRIQLCTLMNIKSEFGSAASFPSFRVVSVLGRKRATPRSRRADTCHRVEDLARCGRYGGRTRRSLPPVTPATLHAMPAAPHCAIVGPPHPQDQSQTWITDSDLGPRLTVLELQLVHRVGCDAHPT